MINVRSKKISIITVVASLLVLMVVLGFTGGLNIASFQENHTESVLNGYAVTGNETVQKIEYAVMYGKPLDNFYDIEIILQEVMVDLPHVEEVQIVLTDGTITYNHEGELNNKRVPAQVANSLNFQNNEQSYMSFLEQDKYNLYLPIRDRAGDWVGSMNLMFDQSVVSDRTAKYMNELFTYLIMLTLVAALFIVIFISKVQLVTEERKIMKKRLLIGFFIILGVSQVLFGAINYNIFKGAYTEIAEENAVLATNIIQKDIETVINKGVYYSQLHDMDSYLSRIAAAVPAIESINLDISGMQEDKSEFVHSLELTRDIRGESVNLNVVMATDYLNDNMREIILDMATVLITSIVLMVEITLFILIFLRQQLEKESVGQLEKVQLEQDMTIVRPLSFILFFAIFMSASYIPILMKELYRPILGLPENVVLGLPISAEMLFAGIAVIVAGNMIDRIGWRKVLFIGFAILGAGLLLSGVAWEPISFILARSTVGMGYGLSLMAMRSFANTAATQEGKTESVSALFAGMYAGIINGVVVGAMFADRIGYSQVFFIALGTVGIAAIFAIMFVRKGEEKATVNKLETEQSDFKIASFLTNKRVVMFFALILIPTAITAMFMDYYFPIFAESLGISTSNIGRAFMLNCLSVVYLGPILSKYASKYLGYDKTILVAGLIVVASMIIFSVKGTLAAAFAAVILLGIADSFGIVAQNNYYTNLHAVKKVGVAKALGLYSNMRKLGQMLGPMVFGGLAFMGLAGVGLVGVLFFIGIIIFWFTREKEQLQS